jgi:NAD(P)-dependent dehydrogenase (short-subunit alcohol dehydrogenase family)
MSDLTGQTALVTCASRGIGRAIAAQLASEGARVAVHYATNRAAAGEVAASIERAGGSAFAVHSEFGLNGVESDVEALFAGLEAGLGGQPHRPLPRGQRRVVARPRWMSSPGGSGLRDAQKTESNSEGT